MCVCLFSGSIAVKNRQSVHWGHSQGPLQGIEYFSAFEQLHHLPILSPARRRWSSWFSESMDIHLPVNTWPYNKSFGMLAKETRVNTIEQRKTSLNFGL